MRVYNVQNKEILRVNNIFNNIYLKYKKKRIKKILGWKIREKVSHPINFFRKSFVPHKKNAKKFRTPADCNTTGYRQLKVTDP